eukprot:NODE_625_length_1902_cov_27.480842_g502_i0.p1 GENE.NODE_625_length_1902_cov_27.480842_g502_i0~~NODE_625_length_1902_cov_27.480842_g502_i0.p1  ORF type:complete len:513 (-),score=52.48 NODE_625_length_1902_cov_27.480842_g502_i0:40-1578(-)
MPRTPSRAGGAKLSWASPARSQMYVSHATTSTAHIFESPAHSHIDRFIPNRSELSLELSHFSLMDEENNKPFSQPPGFNTPSKSKQAEGPVLPSGGLLGPDAQYKRSLAKDLLQNGSCDKDQILALKPKRRDPAASSRANTDTMDLLSERARRHSPRAKKDSRVIPTSAERVLDAPEILDDFYTNTLEWSSTDLVAIGLGPTCFVWNPSTGDTQELSVAQNTAITSVSWHASGNAIAIGNEDTSVALFDVRTQKKLRTLKGTHSLGVTALAWTGSILTSGGRDGLILNHDTRIQNALISKWQHHEQTVCGLKWSPDGTQLASGGNDNQLCVWNAASKSVLTGAKPAFCFKEHIAAVKGIAWAPWTHGLLASGGGTADKTVRFWNTVTGEELARIDTGSQVCGILFSRRAQEFVTSHGYSDNQLSVWKYPALTKITDLTGHTERVLHMALSPHGETVVSAAADETLRFWKVFPPPPEKSAPDLDTSRSSVLTATGTPVSRRVGDSRLQVSGLR